MPDRGGDTRPRPCAERFVSVCQQIVFTKSSRPPSPAAMASVFVPVLYVLIVFGSLLVFSSFYRRKNARMLHTERL